MSNFEYIDAHLISPSTLETRDSILEETKTLHSTSGGFEHRPYTPESIMYSCITATTNPPPDTKESIQRLHEVFQAYNKDHKIPRKQMIASGLGGKFICRPEQADMLLKATSTK